VVPSRSLTTNMTSEPVSTSGRHEKDSVGVVPKSRMVEVPARRESCIKKESQQTEGLRTGRKQERGGGGYERGKARIHQSR
jgi:hypothetical protein